jgi:YgiT-type zinc finger domain-containing protein
MKCPICQKGSMKKTRIKEEIFGICLGMYSAEVCSNCGESFTDTETTREIEKNAKKKGIWGFGAKTKITNTAFVCIAIILLKYLPVFFMTFGLSCFLKPSKYFLSLAFNLTRR